MCIIGAWMPKLSFVWGRVLHVYIYIYIYMHNVTELVVVCKGCWYSCFLSIV